MSTLAQALQSLPAAERERFESLAPYAGTAGLAEADRVWLDSMAAQHPVLADELRHQSGLRRLVQQQERLIGVPHHIGWTRAQAQIRALPKRAAAHGAKQARAESPWWQSLWGWLQPSPAWAMALAVLLLPAGFMIGRETAPPAYSDVRSAVPGLFDGPLLRVSFKPDTSEQSMREVMIEQGALGVGPSRLGDWYLKVAPERVPSVQAALGQQASVAQVAVVPSLPAELVDQP
jgi:hypothetical protein